jgi:hypothetical protein
MIKWIKLVKIKAYYYCSFWSDAPLSKQQLSFSPCLSGFPLWAVSILCDYLITTSLIYFRSLIRLRSNENCSHFFGNYSSEKSFRLSSGWVSRYRFLWSLGKLGDLTGYFSSSRLCLIHRRIITGWNWHSVWKDFLYGLYCQPRYLLADEFCFYVYFIRLRRLSYACL